MADSLEVITVAEFADWLQSLHITLPACKRENSKILVCKPWLTQFVSSFGWAYNFGWGGRGVGGWRGAISGYELRKCLYG